MGYWQDVLAENPNILNPTLNNTGPFRWWLLRVAAATTSRWTCSSPNCCGCSGSARFGGPAGFGVGVAERRADGRRRATIVAAAFLGVEMKCARCHDAPAHASTQQDLFQLAAMLGTKPLTVPATSSVPLDKLHEGGRKPLIKVTLKPGTTVEPAWPFAEFATEDARHASWPSTRTTRATGSRRSITAPQNERFAQVIANRVWKRLMGRGLVEPVDDWEKGKPTHPELLRWLGRELVRGGYDLKHARPADPELARLPARRRPRR